MSILQTGSLLLRLFPSPLLVFSLSIGPFARIAVFASNNHRCLPMTIILVTFHGHRHLVTGHRLRASSQDRVLRVVL